MRTLLSAAAFTATALAQGLPVAPPTEIERSAASTSDLLGAFVACDVSDFDIPDAAYIQGGKVYLMTAPGWFQSNRDLGIPGTTHDLRVVPHADGLRDGLAVLGDYGLGLWTDGAGFSVVDSSWSTVAEIDIGDIDGDGSAIAVGIDDTWVRFARMTGSGPIPQSRRQSGTVLGARFVDHAPQDAGDELGIVTTSGVRIERASSGLAYGSVAATINAARTTRVRTPIGDGFACAVVRSASPGHALLTWRPGAASFEATDLLGQHPVGIAAGDCTNDGFEDVVMTFADGSVDLVYNVAPAPVDGWFYYPVGAGVRVSLPPPSSGEFVRPAVADFDGDGDGDIVQGAVARPQSVTVLANQLTDIEDLRIEVDAPESEHHGGLDVDLAFRVPSTLSATHVEVRKWEVRTDSSGTTLTPLLVSDEAGTTLLHGLEYLPLERVEIAAAAGPTPTNAPELDLSLGYVLVARLVDQNAQPAHYYPGLVVALSTNDHNWDMSNGTGIIGGHSAPEPPPGSSTPPATHLTVTPLPGKEPPDCPDPPEPLPPN